MDKYLANPSVGTSRRTKSERPKAPMHDYENAAIRALENNIQRYTRLLRTKLTPLEQKFLKRRLIEDRLELRRLRASQTENLKNPGTSVTQSGSDCAKRVTDY